MTSKRRRFRFGLRRLLLVVVAVAGCCGVWARSRRLESLATYHERMATVSFQLEDDGSGNFGIAVVRERLRRQWHQAMGLKCRRAKLRPWIGFQPDPVQPNIPPMPRPQFRPSPQGAPDTEVAPIHRTPKTPLYARAKRTSIKVDSGGETTIAAGAAAVADLARAYYASLVA